MCRLLILFLFEFVLMYFHSKIENLIVMNLMLTNLDDDMAKSKNTYLLISKIILALVLFGAAALILILFEKTASMNIYLVYTSVGLILGLGVVQLINAFGKKFN